MKLDELKAQMETPAPERSKSALIQVDTPVAWLNGKTEFGRVRRFDFGAENGSTTDFVEVIDQRGHAWIGPLRKIVAIPPDRYRTCDECAGAAWSSDNETPGLNCSLCGRMGILVDPLSRLEDGTIDSISNHR